MYASLAVAAPRPSPAIIPAAAPVTGFTIPPVGTVAAVPPIAPAMPPPIAPPTAPTVSATSGPTSARSRKVKGMGIPNNLFSSSKAMSLPVSGSVYTKFPDPNLPDPCLGSKVSTGKASG